VLPVCIDTKQDHALYALLSQRPETRQHAMIGISACSIAISLLKYWIADRQLGLVGFVVDPLEGDGDSVVGRASFASGSAACSISDQRHGRGVKSEDTP